jgi:hypothetical protein
VAVTGSEPDSGDDARQDLGAGETEAATVGTGSALAVGCIAAVFVLLLAAIVARVVFHLW